MRKRIAILTLLALMLLPGAAGAESGGELLYNGDFAQYMESADLPSGWEFEAYSAAEADAYVDRDDEYGVFVVLYQETANDSRVYQSVEVEPDTVYQLSAYVRTWGVSGGTGASLSIDNYGIDGTYCYSENLHGTNDWQRVTMYVRTGPEQTQVRAALRLGGYGTTASGQAAFSDVSLSKADAPESAAVIDLATENGTVSHTSVQSTGDVQSEPGTGMFGVILAVAALCAAIFALLYLRVLRYENGALSGYGDGGRFGLPCVLIAAFVLRLALSLIFYGHPTDINCFMAWGNALLEGGIGNFYTSGMFADYPPGYMYICGFLAWLCRLLGLPYGSDAMAFVFKLPATIADLFSAYFVYRIAKQNGLRESFALVLAGILALNPALMFISGAWGQIDTLLTLLLVLVCHFFLQDKKILAGAVYGLAILFKPQALMLGPILAVAYLADCFSRGWKRALLDAALAVAAALSTLLLLSLPFQNTQPWYWLIEKYSSTAASYPYASIEAFNLFSLLGGNWKSVENTVLGVSFLTWGKIGIGLSVAFSAALYWVGRNTRAGRGAALYLSGAVLIAGVFTLGHYMHERYLIPALMLLVMAYLCCRDRRVLAAYGIVGAGALLNVLAAMYVINRSAVRGTFYDIVTALGSLLTIAGFGYLCYVTVQILLLDKAVPDKPAPAKSGGRTSFMQALFGQAPLSSPVLPEKPYDGKLHYTKRDVIYVLTLTLVYGVTALTNLGTLNAPQTYWQSDKAGETVTVSFDRTRHVAQYWVYGNIKTGGTLLISAGEHNETFEQTYDDMFRWKQVETDFTADGVELLVYSGGLKLNEIAFFDEQGDLIPVTLSGAAQGRHALFDEQNTVPDRPSYFNGMYFDELYHGRTAYEHLHNLTPYENSHPPLGKLFIMLGIAVFGMSPFGWRVVGALFGVGMLPILYAFGKRMFQKSEYALLAAGLFAFDFMHFTQTRIATIDVYAVFFILLMYYYMYRYIRMNFFVDGLKKTYQPLFLSGLFFGVGAACKWTCIYAGAGLAVLFFASLVARYYEYLRLKTRGSAAHREQVAPYWRYALKTCGMCCVFFIAIPFAIYFLSYLPYYLYEAGQSADSYYGLRGAIGTWKKYQEFMYNYHSTLNATHPYQSLWYEWPFTVKPMWYYFSSYHNGAMISTMSASGNPAVWWVCSVGAVALLIMRVTNRIKPDRALQILCIGVLANYLPWVLVSRCTFIYHFFGTVPFLILASVYALQKLDERYERLWFVKWMWLGFAIVLFMLMYPGLSGLPVSAEWAAVLHKLPGGKLFYGAP